MADGDDTVPTPGPGDTWVNVFAVTPQDILDDPRLLVTMTQGAITCLHTITVALANLGKHLAVNEGRVDEGLTVETVAGAMSAAFQLMQLHSGKLTELAQLHYADDADKQAAEQGLQPQGEERDYDA